MSRIDIDPVNERPTHAETSQPILHQLHDKVSLGCQAVRRSVTESHNFIAGQNSFRQFPRSRDYESGRLVSGRLSCERKSVQDWLARRVDDGSHIRPGDRISTVNKHSPVFQYLCVLRIEVGKALKAKWAWRSQRNAAQCRLGPSCRLQEFRDSLESLAIRRRALKSDV